MRALITLAILVTAACTAQAEPRKVKQVTALLPHDVEFEAPAALEDILDGDVVSLDITMGADAMPSLGQSDGTFASLSRECAFGTIDAREVSIPTGSNHLLMTLRMGSPGQHAANLLSCEYMPSMQIGENIGQVARVRGCFLVHAVSIPTATQLVLNPLPAQMCNAAD